MGKRWIFAPLLAAAVAGPPLLMNEGDKNKTDETTQSSLVDFQPWNSTQPTANLQNPTVDGLYDDEAAMLNRDSAAYAPGAVDFREAFRFDANPEWLQKNWPHVSRNQSLDGLNGFRVSLVTGPNPQDISGALTYYFNRTGFCERITFYGYTQDTSRIVGLATKHFGLSVDRNLGSGMYTSSFNRRVRSLLSVEGDSASAGGSNNRKKQITFELNNPRGKFTLSPEVSRIVDSQRQMQQASFRR